MKESFLESSSRQIHTSPAPWNRILFSANFFLVTLIDAKIPATATDAVPKTM